MWVVDYFVGARLLVHAFGVYSLPVIKIDKIKNRQAVIAGYIGDWLKEIVFPQKRDRLFPGIITRSGKGLIKVKTGF